MVDDYRNTEYCPKLTELVEKKQKVEDAVKKDHKRAIDMHRYIANNNLGYKKQFIEAYNGKCSYCGVPLGIINWSQFEIDHFIPKNSRRFSTKSQAGYIENLVLSCYDCNRFKSDLEFSDEESHKVNPDGPDIYKSFVRDDDYYIRINNAYDDDKTINDFYYQLKLDSQKHRIDYLLINMLGMRDRLRDKPSAYALLNDAIELIKAKRR